ncbi:MAG: class I SAM-dependent methyltransferase [Chloroflexota bacterium]
MAHKNKRDQPRPAGWEPVADWYDSWMGADGGDHHREVAIPAVLKLAEIQPGEKILDVGAGQGVLAPSITKLGATYTGVDVSERLLHRARDRHGQHERFILADARRLSDNPAFHAGEFDTAIFLLSIQDMQPLEPVLQSASWALKPGGRIVILMTHPCFRIPRQSGWNWDGERKLRYRRVDHYLTPLSVPMKAYPGQPRGVTLSFHRPLEQYVNGLADCGLLVDWMQEIPTHKKAESRADNRANQEIPLFMALRARKLARSG